MDFDDGELSLAQATENVFSDHIHIIGTTRNHQKPKGTKPPCDRFRVAIPFDKPIHNLYTYKHNLGLVADRYPVDRSMCDGADYFFPCQKIISIVSVGYKWNVLKPSPNPTLLKPEFPEIPSDKNKRSMPRWVFHFLVKGSMPKFYDSRNWAVYHSCLHLIERGYTDAEILELCDNCSYLIETKFNCKFSRERLKSAKKRISTRYANHI